jgi:hypothetical protein
LFKSFPGAEDLEQLGVKTIMSTALRHHGELLGFLTFMSLESNAYLTEHHNIASRLGFAVSDALVAAAGVVRLEQQITVSESIGQLVRVFASGDSIESGLAEFTKSLTKLIDVDRAAVTAIDLSRNYESLTVGFD